MGMFDDLNFNETEEEKKRRQQQAASQQDGGYFNDLTFQPATPTPKPQEHPQPAVQQQQQPSFFDNIKNNIISGANQVGDFLSGEYQQITHPKQKQQQDTQTTVSNQNNDSESSAQMTITPQSLQHQRQAAQAAHEVTDALSNIFQGTINQLQQVEDDPLGLKNLDALMKDPKKVMDKVLGTIPQAYQAIGQNVQQLKQDRDNKAPLSKTIGDELKALSSQANFVFSPINTLFNAADSLPVLGSVTKLITAPFAFVGEGATAISNKVIDTLPIPQQAKDNLKPGVGEIFSLASQLVLGHAVAGDAMDKLTNKYGATDAKTIVDTAFDLAKDNKKELPAQSETESNPISDKSVARPEGSELTHVDTLQSFKTEPQQSLDNAKGYIDKSANGEIEARKPLDAITLSDGKKVIVDGNATYQAAKDMGYTHLPTNEYQRENLGLRSDATDDQIIAAVKQKQELEPQVKELVKQAKAADPEFKSTVDQIGQELGLRVNHVPVKTTDSILRKTMVEYDGDLSKLKDVNRATIVVDDPQQLQQVVDKAKEKFGEVVDVKDKFKNKGYNAANISVPLANGRIAELQVTTPEMLNAKTKLGGHKLYEQVRIKAGDWENAEAEMTKLYDEADAATARRLNSSSDISTPDERALKGGNGLPDAVSPNTSLPSESTLTGVPSTSKNRGNLDSAINNTPSSPTIAQRTDEGQPVKAPNTETQQPVTFQSKVAREKQAEFTTQIEKLGNESKNGEEQAGKVSDFVGQVLNTSHDDPASVMGLRTALNKEMQGIVGNNGSFKKNYAMLKYMQASDSPQAHYLSTLEDHIALLDDVIRGKAMDDFARTFGNVPADLPAAPEQAGGSVTLGAGPNPGIDKFIKDDAVPYAKDTVNGMKKVFDEVRTWLAPVTKVPKEALDVIMTHKGEMERQQFRVEQATKDISKMWDKQDDNSRLKFMHDVETDNVTNPKFKPIADFYRERLDAAHQVINNYKNINFIENFFPHFWEKPEDVQKFLARQASRRPLEGSKSFLKERVFETIKEGMEAGYTPVSTNPEEIMQIYENNVRKFQMAQEIKGDLLDKGFWKFVRAGDKAPEGFAPVNDRIAKIYFPPDITEVTVNGSEIKKMIEAGEYHAQEDVARIINNYLSPDLIRDTALGKGFMNMKNTMNAFEMGLSAFHGTMETFDSIITHGSIGLSRIFNEGKVMKGLQDIFTSPAAPVKYFRDGQKFFNGDPELTKIENDLFTGGASLQNHQYFKNTVYDTFLQRVREGNVLGAAVRTPLATIEAAMRPLMSYYIPRLKIGAFRHQFGAELERNSQLIQDGKMTREELARKTWSNIENRMGELNYDNLFWNRTMKASLMLSLRAVGWNLGTAREIGGGVFADAPAQVVNMVKLQRPELTPKMAYTLNLLFTTAAASSVYQYLHTGKAPTSLLDMFYPQNGSTDKNGNPVRVQFPTYLKDMYAASHHPIKMVGDKLAPELTTLISLLNNKDYYGNYIRNEHDNLPTQTKQLGAYLINQMAPFSIQGVQQQAQGKASIPAQLENFLGIQKAPIDTMKTDKQRRLQDAATAQLGAMGPQTPEEQHISQLKAQARKDVVAGTPLKQSAAFMELVKSGTIKTRLQAENFVRDAGKTPDQRLFQHLSTEKKKEVLQIK